MNIVPDYSVAVTQLKLEYVASKESTCILLLEKNKYPYIEPGTIIRYYSKETGATVLRRVNHVIRNHPALNQEWLLSEDELLN